MRRLLPFLTLTLSAGCLNITVQAPSNAPGGAGAAPVPTVTNIVNITNIVNVTNIIIVTKVVEVTNFVNVLSAPAVRNVINSAVSAPQSPVVLRQPDSTGAGLVVTNRVPEIPPELPKPVKADGPVELVREDERDLWKVSVGASVIGGVRPRLGANHFALNSLSGFGTAIGRLGGGPGGGRSKADAYAAGSGASGVRRFDGGAWYDPHDAASANDPGWSWNWRLHDPPGRDPDGKKGFTEYTAYSEAEETIAQTVAGDGAGCSSDSYEWFPGLRAEIARELYRSDGERPWGVDCAVAFAYYFQRGIWRASGTAASASLYGRREQGAYEWWNDSEDTAQYILDYERETQFRNGMWGAGTFSGPGAELETSAWRVRDVVSVSDGWSSSHALRYRGDGDYREYSIEVLVRPWWEPWEWLRIFGSLGIEVSRREFEWSISATGTDGSVYRESGDTDDWRAVGLLGGGFALQWYDFTLAGEVLWRFAGDDLDVCGRTVNGQIEHGNWGFRTMLGYEF